MDNPSKKIKYVLIGCGRIAPNHIAAALANDKELEIAAVCDIIPENMEKLLAKFGLENSKIKRYEDYREMLKIEKPDLAAVATDSGKHAEIALEIINAGCNVIVEKPIAMSLDDADRLIAAAKAKGVKLCACHQNRFNKSIQKIRAALETGRFGKLYHAAAHIRWNRVEDYYRQASWRGKWASDGGALMNQCIHNIDLLRWMLGDPVEVMAYTDRLAHPYIEAEDLGLAIVKFKNGAYGLIEGTTNVFPKNLEETLYIFGEKGTVKAGGKSVNRIEEWSFADNMAEREDVIKTFSENPPNVYGFGHTPLYADMASAIKNDRDPYVSGEAGRAALELVLAIYKSAALGGPVKLPLEHCASVDFTGRFDKKAER
ncbi:oxidoreductase domain protein [[Clostridium] cellulosi]|uniref:Oxidoreductase domain protein n=1 Tax=[Clostridium] cellulosi TaxID=29343 RepID=A0A078KRU2_9FIRM|nr:oxidoreductase domain protein [[Clostridium] cellulosi]